MSELQSQSSPGREQESEHSVVFAQLLFQLSNTAMVLMGRVSDPESGKHVQDMDAARLFIDQVEMLESKTKGNLTAEETSLLKQTLMTLRMSFVQAVEAAEKRTREPQAAQTAPAQPQGDAAPAGTAPPPEEEHRKKFSKKY